MRRSSGLRIPASTICDLALGPAEEARDLLERVLGGAQADPLQARAGATGGAAGLQLEALERQRQVRAALGRGHGVDLVDDHRLRTLEHAAGLGGEDQVQGLGGRDEDVRRVAGHRGALALGGVAGADPDPDLVGPDPLQGGPQVALDVVRERLQRADVDHAHARSRLLVGHQPVERPQERGQRLARARGSAHEHVLAAGDRRPGLLLGGGGLAEGALEPAAGGGCEVLQGHPGSRLSAPPGRLPADPRALACPRRPNAPASAS